MKNFVIYFFVIFLFVVDVDLVTGSEKWPEDRPKVLQSIVDVNQLIKSNNKANDLFKSEVMELINQNRNEIDELKGSLLRKQTRIDQLENNESFNQQEIKALRTELEAMAIQGMKM